MARGSVVLSQRLPLTNIDIDVDKDWDGKRITNLGAPTAGTDACTPAYAGLMVRDFGLLWGEIYSRDSGLNWADLGAIAAPGRIYGMANLGNGIALFGDDDRHVFRSTDYGETWTDQGLIVAAAGGVNAILALGNGIVLMGENGTHIYRSVDNGQTWVDLGVIVPSATWGMAYFGNGIVLVGDWNGHVFRSEDDGATWADLGDIALGSSVYAITYLGDGIALIGAGNYSVFRSVDYGATWTDLGPITTRDINCMVYLANGIVVMGDIDYHVHRSEDYGLTWVDLGIIAVGDIYVMAHLGNGIVIMGDNLHHVYRSIDYGGTWVDLGVITTDAIHAMAYLGNGIAILGDNDGHIWRSASPFQLSNFHPHQFDKVFQFGCLGAITANGTSYLAPGNGATQLNEIRVRVPRPGILRNLYVWQRVASGAAGRTDIYTVRVNGMLTAIICTLNNQTEGFDAEDEVLVAAGDQVSIRLVSNDVLDASADVSAVVELM